MKTILITILFIMVFGTARTVTAKAYYAGKREMIQKAECIAVVKITNIENADKKGKTWTYRKKASATVESCLKGNAKGEIEIYGMETFICAKCRYEKGRFILFLRKEKGVWVGSNWHLGIRAIRKGKVEWFKNDKTRFEMKTMPLVDVIDEITAIIKEQSLFSQNDIWSHMSFDGSSLTIPKSAKIMDVDWHELANNHGFRSLQSLSINNRNITSSAFKCLLHAPIEELNLNGATFSSDELMELLDHLPQIKRLNIANTKFSDKELTHIRGTNLTDLVIYNTDVTDKGIISLMSLVNIVHLNLPGKNLTNDGYKRLQYLSRLTKLILSYKGVSDATIEYIRNLKLGTLSIYDADISDRSMGTIGNIASLTSLALPKCKIGDKGIEQITSLDQLAEIRLTFTLISDASMYHLNQIKSLRKIELFSTEISDLGLNHLQDLPKLKHIGLKHTKVTNKGIRAFKERFPDVYVTHNLD